MSSMDGLRSQLSQVQEQLRDVLGRLDALENRAPTATVSPVTVTPTEVKPQASIAKPPSGAGGVASRKP